MISTSARHYPARASLKRAMRSILDRAQESVGKLSIRLHRSSGLSISDRPLIPRLNLLLAMVISFFLSFFPSPFLFSFLAVRGYSVSTHVQQVLFIHLHTHARTHTYTARVLPQ